MPEKDAKDKEQLIEDTIFHAVFDSCKAAALLCDTDTIIDANPAFFHLSGFEKDDIVGTYLDDIFQAPSLSAPEGKRLLLTNSGEKKEGLLSTSPFAETPENCNLALFQPLPDSEHDGKSGEISPPSEEEARLRLSDFLARLSLEFRTPLNTIVGFTEMMHGRIFGPLGNAHYQDYARGILECARYLSSLLNDLSDLSKIERGNLQLREEHLLLTPILSSCITMIQSASENKDREIVLDMEPDLPLLLADERRIRQIFVNLLSMALRQSPKDSPVILHAFPAAHGQLRIDTTSTSSRMAGNKQRAPSPFGDINASLLGGSHQDESIGIPLIEQLVQMHKGSIKLREKDGKTTISILFPQERLKFTH